MWVLLAIIVIAVLVPVVIYNQLIIKRNQASNSFAQIDVQLQLRHDLIPNLVEAVKGYIGHEQATLTQITQARSNAMQARSAAAANKSSENLNQLATAENQLSESLMKLYAVAEQYPDLKADAIVSDLMETLNSTENKISYARQVFNDDVMLFNNACQIFPNNILASMFRFSPMRQLHIDSAAKIAPKVQF